MMHAAAAAWSEEAAWLSAAGIEHEFKFLADEASFAAAQVSPLLAARTRPTVQLLRSVYFDTAEGDLWRAGLVLRVRRRGQRYLMTLKTAVADPSNRFARQEAEIVLPGPVPDPALFEEGLAEMLAEAAEGRPLLERVVTSVRRVVHEVEWQGSLVEVAFDSGAVIAGGHRAAIREIELELKAGPIAGLVALARAVTAAFPVRLGVMTKSERGMTLASGTIVDAVRAGSALDGDVTLDEAIAAVVTNCVQHFVANWPGFETSAGTEPVHQMRVAMRRLRAALGLFQRALPDAGLAAFRGEARRIASAMGEARNWDVFVDLVRDGPAGMDEAGDGFTTLLAACARRQAEGYRRVEDLLGAAQTTRFVIDMLDLAARRGWRDGLAVEDLAKLAAPVSQFAAGVLHRLHRRVRKRGRGILTMAPAERHEVRIALKSLRYATDFFGPVFDDASAVRSYARAAARVQDVLGGLNDIDMINDLVPRLELGADPGPAYAAGMVVGWYGRAAQADLARLSGAWHKFHKAKPFWKSALRGIDPAD